MDSREIMELRRLAALIRQRNDIDAEIAKIIGRPAEKGHIGEHIACYLFDIEMGSLANQPGSDGRFRSGPLAGQSVNVKCYPKRENILDMTLANPPDHYLVLAGPRRSAASSRGTTRPLVVQDIFLFETASLMSHLHARKLRISEATSVREEYWKAARIDVTVPDQRLRVSPSIAIQVLELLGCVIKVRDGHPDNGFVVLPEIPSGLPGA